MNNYNHLLVGFFKNSELLQELAKRIKDKRIRFTQRLEGQCIGGLLSWDESDKYWLDLTELDGKLGQYWKTHWHTLKTEPEKITTFYQKSRSPSQRDLTSKTCPKVRNYKIKSKKN